MARSAVVAAVVALAVLSAYAWANRPQAGAASQPGGVAGHDHASHDHGGAPAHANSPRRAGRADPCSEVIQAMGQPAPNRLHAAGLGDDRCPVVLVAPGKEAARIRAVLSAGRGAARASLWEHVAGEVGATRPV